MQPRERMHQCVNCLHTGPKKRSCGSCRYAHYCNTECQKADWKEHKKLCKETAVDYLLLKKFPSNYPLFYDSVSNVAHIYAEKHNVSAIWMNIEREGDSLTAEMHNISLNEIVDEVKTVPGDSEIVEQMVSAYDCLDPYKGIVHIIISYKNLTCSFCDENRSNLNESAYSKIKESDSIFIKDYPPCAYTFAITSGQVERIKFTSS